MKKNFSNLLNKKKDRDSSTIKPSEVKSNKRSNPLIIFGSLVSLASMFLLLFTINNKFG